jgi:hypothetical protein
MDDIEDWDEEFGFSPDAFSPFDANAGHEANRIVGITAERFVETPENTWDDAFELEATEEIFLHKSSNITPSPLKSVRIFVCSWNA